jgi:glycosidase
VGRLDGCLDFHLGESLRRTFARGVWTETDLERFVERHYAYFPDHFLLPTFLDNHDMDRFLFVAKEDKAALMRAATFQMNLPQPPIIYYGTEVGLSQTRSATEGFGLEMSRTPMIWDDRQDKDLLAYYKRLIRKRKSAP